MRLFPSGCYLVEDHIFESTGGLAWMKVCIPTSLQPSCAVAAKVNTWR